MEDSQFAEVVYLFVDGQVAAELSYADFEAHIDRQTPIHGAPPGACVSRAGFAIVGPELRVHGLVFFLLQVDEQGRPDKNFNVPLPYLAKNAGAGPDLGYGPVPMACRGSCSVPWHANNLWDPSVDEGTNPMDALVAAVQTNNLQLEFTEQRVDENQPLEQRADMSAQIAELSASHTAQLLEMQRTHEDELAELREALEAKTELYRQEVRRLRDELERLNGGAPDVAAER